MLGSVQDAEDVLQETLVAAWRGPGRFEGRASLRTWLYRIATNRCLNAPARSGRATRGRPAVRPARAVPRARVRPGSSPTRTQLPEGFRTSAGPEARYELREAVELAFIAALQRLPPDRGPCWCCATSSASGAAEVAEMLDSSVESVKGALKRARATP